MIVIDYDPSNTSRNDEAILEKKIEGKALSVGFQVI